MEEVCMYCMLETTCVLQNVLILVLEIAAKQILIETLHCCKPNSNSCLEIPNYVVLAVGIGSRNL